MELLKLTDSTTGLEVYINPNFIDSIRIVDRAGIKAVMIITPCNVFMIKEPMEVIEQWLTIRELPEYE